MKRYKAKTYDGMEVVGTEVEVKGFNTYLKLEEQGGEQWIKIDINTVEEVKE